MKAENRRGPILHSISEICEYVGMGRKAVLTAIREDAFPAIRMSTGWKSLETSVDKWLQGKIEPDVGK